MIDDHKTKKPTVCMMLGLPGSRKTTFSKQLQVRLGVRRFAVDEEYSNIAGHAWGIGYFGFVSVESYSA